MKSSLVLNGEKILDEVGLIVFDKDGTLIDIHHYWFSMIELRAKKLIDSFAIQNEVESLLIEAMGGNTKSASKRLKPEGPIGIKSREYIVSVVCELMTSYVDHVTREDIEKLFKEVDVESGANMLLLLKVLPGVVDFLDKCSEKKIQMAIGTTDLTSRAKLALEMLGMDKYFTHIVGGDLVKCKKPAPDCGNLLLEKSEVSADNAVMIGDHTVDTDMGVACNFGCSVGVSTGLLTFESLRDSTKYVMKNFNELDVI